MKTIQCLACGNEKDNRVIVAREMLRGTKQPFEYSECSACGSLQIVRPPEDLTPFYGDSYYSFRERNGGFLRRSLKRQWARHALGYANAVGFALCRFRGSPEFADWFLALGAGLDSSVLDIGCGKGALLKDLRNAGFSNLTGIDPFLQEESLTNGLRLLKRGLADMEGNFDLVMAHHSFEHMPSPSVALADMRRLLKPGGNILLRCPVAGSQAWREYGADWVQLDAPRHLFIPSVKGFSELARSCGLQLWKVAFDSTAIQFWGSELYRREISLRQGRQKRYFSKRALRQFAEEARIANRTSQGDSACFYLHEDQDRVRCGRD